MKLKIQTSFAWCITISEYDVKMCLYNEPKILTFAKSCSDETQDDQNVGEGKPDVHIHCDAVHRNLAKHEIKEEPLASFRHDSH